MICQSVENYFPRGLMTLLVYMGWIVDVGETWVLEASHR